VGGAVSTPSLAEKLWSCPCHLVAFPGDGPMQRMAYIRQPRLIAALLECMERKEEPPCYEGGETGALP